ncbi:MAG TPA: hypothetical protein P5572_15010, partial [Phycisphaerae bacterium]|nr:hypothetical protein [Phycisphaerae bacterium]
MIIAEWRVEGSGAVRLRICGLLRRLVHARKPAPTRMGRDGPEQDDGNKEAKTMTRRLGFYALALTAILPLGCTSTSVP